MQRSSRGVERQPARTFVQVCLRTSHCAHCHRQRRLDPVAVKLNATGGKCQQLIAGISASTNVGTTADSVELSSLHSRSRRAYHQRRSATSTNHKSADKQSPSTNAAGTPSCVRASRRDSALSCDGGHGAVRADLIASILGSILGDTLTQSSRQSPSISSNEWSRLEVCLPPFDAERRHRQRIRRSFRKAARAASRMFDPSAVRASDRLQHDPRPFVLTTRCVPMRGRYSHRRPSLRQRCTRLYRNGHPGPSACRLYVRTSGFWHHDA